MPSNKVVINNTLEYEIPDDKMDELMDYLNKSATGVKSEPAYSSDNDNGTERIIPVTHWG